MTKLRSCREFLSVMARYFCRHPAKLNGAWEHWSKHKQRREQLFDGLVALTCRERDEIIAVFDEVDVAKFERLIRHQTRREGVDAISYSPYAMVLYCLVRLEQPTVVVETGVEHGMSSWLILAAMEKNRKGELHSIDLANHTAPVDGGGKVQSNKLPPGRQPGWLIPNELRPRWSLYLGDSRELLPAVLSKLGKVDIFIHDSLHSYEHMMFEYRTAWPFVRWQGLLLSDDIDWNSAFQDFSREVSSQPVDFGKRLGALRRLPVPR